MADLTKAAFDAGYDKAAESAWQVEQDAGRYREMIMRVIAGLEVALLEPYRARGIVEDLHDECVTVINGGTPRALESDHD